HDVRRQTPPHRPATPRADLQRTDAPPCREDVRAGNGLAYAQADVLKECRSAQVIIAKLGDDLNYTHDVAVHFVYVFAGDPVFLKLFAANGLQWISREKFASEMKAGDVSDVA